MASQSPAVPPEYPWPWGAAWNWGTSRIRGLPPLQGPESPWYPLDTIGPVGRPGQTAGERGCSPHSALQSSSSPSRLSRFRERRCPGAVLPGGPPSLPGGKGPRATGAETAEAGDKRPATGSGSHSSLGPARRASPWRRAVMGVPAVHRPPKMPWASGPWTCLYFTVTS